jgi:hypothetical protein
VGFDGAASPTADNWSLVSSGIPSSMKASLPPLWPAGLTLLPTTDGVALNHVLKFAGARPADRDVVDARIVKSVRDRTGRILNCISADGSARCERNAGGWPTWPSNRRALTLPADYKTVTPGGYTKLELWLHEMAAQVEGRSNRIPVPPTLANGR